MRLLQNPEINGKFSNFSLEQIKLLRIYQNRQLDRKYLFVPLVTFDTNKQLSKLIERRREADHLEAGDFNGQTKLCNLFQF